MISMKKCRNVVEALLFASGEPITAARLAEAMETDAAMVERALESLQQEYDKEKRGIQLLQLGDCWQMATRDVYEAPVKKLLDTRRNTPLTQAALEVLAIIAYNQPVSRGFIEQVRGVDSSSTVAKLLEKGLIEEAGRLDLPGHPVSFRTTPVFLRSFGLKNLAELPPLHEEEPEETETEKTRS